MLGYPFFPNEMLSAPSTARAFRKLIFFGRLETRKGIELFVETLRYCRQQLGYRLAEQLDEILLIGKHEGQHVYARLDALIDEIEQVAEVPVRALTDLTTHQAQDMLREEAAHSLVVMPSLVDNFPFTVIEASLIPQITVLTSTQGGMGEILGPKGADQLFDPFPRPFAHKLVETLAAGPKSGAERAAYDWQAANQRWLDFHRDVMDYAHPQQAVSALAPSRVDICIPHHNHGRYLRQLLAALAHQTVTGFGVIVIDDASTDPDSQDAFAELEAQYASQGWRFYRNAENQGLSQTRNIAVEQSGADYVIFMDADNVPAPQMFERMLAAIGQSQMDCLACYAIAFEGDGPPYALDKPYNETRAIERGLYRYLPLGASAELGLFTNSFGDANFIIKRSVFDALGGFTVQKTHYRYIAGEDHALLAQLCLSGYTFDVIPEFLFFYRFRFQQHVPHHRRLR